MEPQEVTVIVYGARSLQGRKKDRHKYWVTFGVGSNKFRTQTVVDPLGGPTWNEESVIPIDDPSQSLVFTVKEKEDSLGRVTLLISDLPSAQQKRQHRAPLQPHKKCPHPHGELIYECWVSKYRDRGVPTINVTGSEESHKASRFTKFKEHLAHSPILNRKTFTLGKSPSSHAALGRRNSRSIQDLRLLTADAKDDYGSPGIYRTSSNQNLSSDGPELHLSPLNSSVNKRSSSSNDVSPHSPSPEVTSVHPREGSSGGGTRLTIKGINLGKNKDDIGGLTVCGLDCLESLEYESPTKIYCTTKAHCAGNGDIIVQTKSGGRGSSMVHYAFLDRPEDSAKRRSSATFTWEENNNVSQAETRQRNSKEFELSPKTSKSNSKEDHDAKRSSKEIEASKRNSKEVDTSSKRNSKEILESSKKNSKDDTPTKRNSKEDSSSKKNGKEEKRNSKEESSSKRTSKEDSFFKRNSKEECSSNSGTPEHKKGHGFLARLSGCDKREKSESEPSTPELRKKKDKCGCHREELLAEITQLKEENKTLKEENSTMKLYIDHLVARVMEECPEALSSQPGHT